MSRTTSRSRTVAALVAGAVLVPTTAMALSQQVFTGHLADLVTSGTSGLAGAAAEVHVLEDARGTTVRLEVEGIDPALAGHVLGAHVHTGPCIAEAPAAAAGHYNHGGGISDRTEVWLDFRVTASGLGHSAAHVPFHVPEDGAASVVIHAEPTAPNGAAGARLACLPVDL